MSLISNLQNIAYQLKNAVTSCCRHLEQEKYTIVEFAQEMKNSIRADLNESQTLFKSFIYDDDPFMIKQTNEDIISLKNYSES